MNKRLALAYRIIEIDKQKYFVVFPPPSKEQTNRIDFDYTEYLNTLIKQLRTTPLKERESLIEKWASLVKIEQSDMLLKKVQIEYEKLLKLREGEEKLSKIYMEKKEEVTKDSKNDDKTTIAKQKEEQLTKKFQEIKATSEKRFARFLEAKDEARNLYLYDLQEMNKNPAQRQFKRAFFAHLDMGIQEELTELELETMTLGEIWEYNKCYLERKEAKHLKRKIKKKVK